MPYIGNSPKNNVRGRFYYTATAAQTVFSGADSNGKTLAYQDGGYVDVYLNGVLLQDTTDYTATTKTSVTLTSGATAGDLVEIVAYGIFSVADTVSAASGGTFQSDINVVGTVTSDGLTVDGNSSITGDLTVDTDTLYVDSTNNRVGIGTSSPDTLVEVSADSGNASIKLARSNTASTDDDFGSIVFENSVGTTLASIRGVSKSGNTEAGITFGAGGGDGTRMTLDNSGNLLVGQSSTTTPVSSNVVGTALQAGGRLELTCNGNTPIRLNRKASDGDIVQLRKDGTVVGRLGTQGTYLHIEGSTAGAYGLKFVGSSYIRPSKNDGLTSDNELDLGTPTARFDDIYATNGTIQTSDANLKTSIASLTDAEITAAKAISKLFKTFKWNDKVAEKGDAVRTHAGVIAQDVAQAMTDAGLDAGNYAFFISTTWWETQTEVPAVDEVVDEDGNVITEAKEAYTRTDTYDTLEESPAGATERTRLGIRYPELLAFIGAATEQRLTSIEARLDALETP